MSYKYIKQNWETYDKTLPSRLQEDSIITKKRLEHMEEGIEKNSKSLVIGDLTLGDSPIPSASIEEDENSEDIKLNIVFPKQSQIEDSTIKEDSTWSSRKIRAEIDIIAQNTRYTCEIYSNEGLLFNSASDVKTLKAKILKTGEEITNLCDPRKMTWTRKSSNTDFDDFWNGKGYTGTSITVSASDLNETTNVTYTCTYVGVDDSGVTIGASGSITVCNMIVEAVNTSVSFTVDAPNGTIFDNKSGSTLILEAQAYQGAIDITRQASFNWYMNGVWIPDEESYRLSYPIVGVPLVCVFTCEMKYDHLAYRNSITVQNRKNVTVSSISPNDPQSGDIWYDADTELYKKWVVKNGNGYWQTIEDPTKEVTGDILISVSAIKTVQETNSKIETLRSETYEFKDEITGEVREVRTYTNNEINSANGKVTTLTKTVDGIQQNLSNLKLTAEEMQLDIQDINGNINSLQLKSNKVDLLIEDGSTSSNLLLTSQFMKVLTGSVVIDASNIDLRGYTTINDDGTGGVTIDEDGYLYATKGGKIGPWDIGDDYLSMTLSDLEYVYLGRAGLNFSNKLKLTPNGGIDSPNFKVDPDEDSITLNAYTLQVSGVDVITKSDRVGVKNLILTSGAYRIGKPTFWEFENLKWELDVQGDNADNTDPNNTTIANTYMVFTKLEENNDQENPGEHYIKIPLSEPLNTTGTVKYNFNINVFGTGETRPGIRIYLLTDNNDAKLIGELSTVPTIATNYNFTIEHRGSASLKYKYIGFKDSDFAVDDTFSIINMSLYKSEIIVKEWQPAPEDTVNDYQRIDNSLTETVTDITTTLSETKGEVSTKISTIFESDDWKKECASVFTQNRDGVSIDSITRTVQNINTIATDGIETQSQRIDEIHKYIDLKNGNISLYNNQDNIKLTLENKQLSFVEDDVITAYFSSNKLNVNQLEAVESLQIGNFKFLSRSDGTLTVVKADIKDKNTTAGA